MPAPSSPPTGIDTTYPVIVYNSKNLWIPRKWSKPWEPVKTPNSAITKGGTYIQVVSNPVRYEVANTTVKFPDTSAAWVEGEAAQLFTVAWDAFMSWAQLGKVFSFYRNASDSGARSYFQYCVWTLKDDGLRLTTGNPRYTLEIAFATEGAAR